jgi:hypothetical protein
MKRPKPPSHRQFNNECECEECETYICACDDYNDEMREAKHEEDEPELSKQGGV